MDRKRLIDGDDAATLVALVHGIDELGLPFERTDIPKERASALVAALRNPATEADFVAAAGVIADTPEAKDMYRRWRGAPVKTPITDTRRINRQCP